MNIAYLDLLTPIQLDENMINVLVIENKKLFREMLQQFMQALLGLDSKWILSEASKAISLNKSAVIIADPLNIDLNERKLLDGLYNEMGTIAVDESHCMETSKIRNNLLTYVNSVMHEVDYPLLEANEISILNLFKLAGVRFEPYEGELLEKIVSYAYLCTRFKRCRLIVFVNLKTYFSDEELGEFYKDMLYKKIHILLVENRETPRMTNEKIMVIDNDLCVVKC
ncbi:MAG: type II-A CRISPR-associated protein Csn2 [Phascolarctobacterium sp.]|uniref:type II-A CRISPR-associated protein Csn2 n=1 Tax=Phascolarctobacterium sp. TaxID=2049039 RepID=UPI0026DCCBC8|nr:type II-A CRISPR-associated protein Csn2 [Phascolarctobacterium sp.]MDO4920881.1 type II-A CRISPR-associated protein Csn2 [Phascolarctobacterium sp.]